MLVKTKVRRDGRDAFRTTIYTRSTFGDAKDLRDNPYIEIVETSEGELERVIQEQELGTFQDYK